MGKRDLRIPDDGTGEEYRHLRKSSFVIDQRE